MLVHYNSVKNSIKPGFRNACPVFIFQQNAGGGIFPGMFSVAGESKFDLVQHQERTGGSRRAVGGAMRVRSASKSGNADSGQPPLWLLPPGGLSTFT